MCDTIPLARELWSHHCRAVLPWLCTAIFEESECTMWTLSRQQYMHVLMKVLFQYFLYLTTANLEVVVEQL